MCAYMDDSLLFLSQCTYGENALTHAGEHACRSLPPNHVVDIAEVLHGWMAAAPRDLVQSWLGAAAALHKPGIDDVRRRMRVLAVA